MHFVFTSAQIRALDQSLLDHGLLEVTVENAGRSVAERLHLHAPEARVLVVAGKGFNGADALVAARHLLALGHRVRVLAHPEAHAASVQKWQVFGALEPLNNDALHGAFPASDVVLEGLLGTGFRPPLKPEFQEVIAALNASGLPIFSIDLPSGIEADVAVQPEQAIQATVTLALAGLKPCHLFDPARKWSGHTEVLSIGVPESHMDQFTTVQTLESRDVRLWLPDRDQSAHKGSAGEVWVLGGRKGMTGCVALSALAALRMGSGLVRFSSTVPVEHAPMESIGHEIQSWQEAKHLPFKGAVALGMGLGEEAPQVALDVLEKHLPVVIDADALQTVLKSKGHEKTVFTPHPGEAARMLETTIPELLKDPIQSARALQAQYGGVVVLKGGPTVIANAEQVWINTSGNPGMASAGMGDTLAGIIASLMGQGLSATHAALCGVHLHGRAGDLCFKLHQYGLQASDVSQHLGQAWQTILSGD